MKSEILLFIRRENCFVDLINSLCISFLIKSNYILPCFAIPFHILFKFFDSFLVMGAPLFYPNMPVNSFLEFIYFVTYFVRVYSCKEFKFKSYSYLIKNLNILLVYSPKYMLPPKKTCHLLFTRNASVEDQRLSTS